MNEILIEDTPGSASIEDAAQATEVAAPLLECSYWCSDPVPVLDEPAGERLALSVPEREAHVADAKPMRDALIVAPAADEVRVAALLDAGAARVHVGTLAVRDVAAVARLIERHGADRLGLWLPVRRMPVQWRFDRESNADFSCLTPDCPVPRWEVLAGDSGTGVDVEVWLRNLPQGELLPVILAVPPAGDVCDEDICARIARHPGGLWLTSLAGGPSTALDGYVRYSGVRRVILDNAGEDDDAAVTLAELARQNDLERTRRALFDGAELRHS
ncbi:MAG: hypothetical protein PHQ14_08380 [Chromatiales bacterium]|jgi:hypothetical protein|nr:hypothetical protein [Chromatiales bacterium]MDX9767122.1 hypothetical protein [Ectothiorhodospiraceae bacterium]